MWPLISLEGLRCRRGPMVLFALILFLLPIFFLLDLMLLLLNAWLRHNVCLMRGIPFFFFFLLLLLDFKGI